MANIPPSWALDDGLRAGLTEFEVCQAWRYALTMSGFLDCIGSSPGTDEIFKEVVAATGRYRKGLVAMSGVGDAVGKGDGEGA